MVIHFLFSFHLIKSRNKKIKPCIHPAFYQMISLIRLITVTNSRADPHKNWMVTSNSSLEQIQSISLASLLKYPHFRSSRPELFCNKGVLKNFAKFTGVSTGTGVSCEFCDILKNIFFCRTPQVAASGICSNRDFLFSYCM